MSHNRAIPNARFTSYTTTGLNDVDLTLHGPMVSFSYTDFTHFRT